MAVETLYVRVKIADPKRGYKVERYHFGGHLFVGGDRPVWYRVKSDFAALCREDAQENGFHTFDVVTAEEKVAIDAEEEKRRLVQLGLISATMTSPKGAQAIDLSTDALGIRGSARGAAVPTAGGDLTTTDLLKR